MANMLNLWSQFEKTGDTKLIKQFTKVLDKNKRLESRLAATYMNTLLVRMYIKAGKWDDADIVIDSIVNKLNTHHEFFFMPELYRLKALIGWKRKSATPIELEAYFNQATQAAKQQSSLGLELRAVCDYCQYLQSINHPEKAEQKLDEILQRMNEGLSTQDYKKAEILLEQLRDTTIKQTESSAV